MAATDDWCQLRYHTNQLVSLRRYLSRARQDGDQDELKRLSVDIVHVGLVRDRLLTRISRQFVA